MPTPVHSATVPRPTVPRPTVHPTRVSTPPPDTDRLPSDRRLARAIGVLFLVATVTYLTGDLLAGSLVDDAAGPAELLAGRGRVAVGLLLMLANSMAVVGIGTLFHPILNRYGRLVANGYLATRIIEGTVLAGGIAGLGALASAAGGSAATSSWGSVAALATGFNDTAFLVAMVVLGLGSLPLCLLLYRERLIPHPLAMLGLVGYGALAVGAGLELAGHGALTMLVVPGAVFELGAPLWMIVRGLGGADRQRRRVDLP